MFHRLNILQKLSFFHYVYVVVHGDEILMSSHKMRGAYGRITEVSCIPKRCKSSFGSSSLSSPAPEAPADVGSLWLPSFRVVSCPRTQCIRKEITELAACHYLSHSSLNLSFMETGSCGIPFLSGP